MLVTIVQKGSPIMAFVSQWGSFGSAHGQINNLRRVAVDPSGNVFVADFGNDRIEFDGNSKLIRNIILR
jgi:DNA-binding beta-propeller fold protein YncE